MKRGFYPACEAHFTRRRFLRFALGVSLAPAVGLGSPRGRHPVEDARDFIQRYAVTPQDPWAVVHGIRALGGECRLLGENAATYVLRTCTRKQAVHSRYYLYFPASVEIHPNSFLKTFLEAGVPRTASFPVEGQTFRLEDVADGAKALFRFDPTTFDPNHLPWSLIAFAELRAGEWTNAYGERIHLKAVAAFGLQALQRAMDGLMPYFQADQPLPAKMPIHGFTCGGTHLCYSLLVAARHGFIDATSWSLLRQQLDLLIYRMRRDPELIDRHYQRLGAAADVELFRAGAKLKVVGHILECLGYALTHDLLPPDQRIADSIEAARQQAQGLLAYATRLDLEAVRRRSPQLYQQIIGDACHAYRGLSLT